MAIGTSHTAAGRNCDLGLHAYHCHRVTGGSIASLGTGDTPSGNLGSECCTDRSACHCGPSPPARTAHGQRTGRGVEPLAQVVTGDVEPQPAWRELLGVDPGKLHTLLELFHRKSGIVHRLDFVCRTRRVRQESRYPPTLSTALLRSGPSRNDFDRDYGTAREDATTHRL